MRVLVVLKVVGALGSNKTKLPLHYGRAPVVPAWSPEAYNTKAIILTMRIVAVTIVITIITAIVIISRPPQE